jgi:hypothetical protein
VSERSAVVVSMSAPPYSRVTLWVTLGSSCTAAVRPDESRLSALTCTDGQAGTP